MFPLIHLIHSLLKLPPDFSEAWCISLGRFKVFRLLDYSKAVSQVAASLAAVAWSLDRSLNSIFLD